MQTDIFRSAPIPEAIKEAADKPRRKKFTIAAIVTNLLESLTKNRFGKRR